VRALFTTLILLLIFSGCFGSREGSDDTSRDKGGDEEEPDFTGSTGAIGGGVSPRVSRDGGSSSGYCGDGILQYSNSEQCDRYDLGRESCGSLSNYTQSGELRCNADCTFNVIGCYDVRPSIDGGRWDGGRVIRDAGRNRTIIIDYDDAGEDDGARIAVGGDCVRSNGSACDRDLDCRVGGCGGEICYNPDLLDLGNPPCDGCRTPTNMSCGCVNGGCTWWYE